MDKVCMIPPLLNCCMPEIYQNTDIGVFPSRCEAGTNLVLMEYMACGKPVIASIETGQGDIVNKQTGLIIKSNGKCGLYDSSIDKDIVAYWEEPSVESLIENLEYSYNNRNTIRSIGINGSNLMAKYTWKNMANKIIQLI
jgi:glycosyltransferase involved in cell wall biosynthesis